MKKITLPLITMVSIFFANAQNVGIGTTTPGFPLNFSNTLGDKISLYGNSGSHYGLGIQSGLLQIHTDAGAANIAFGYGSSNSFTERMRILNNGNYDGMSLNGRLILKNGSNDPVGGGGGVWLYKANNSSLLGFMGTQNNQNIGFYGGSGGWGFTYDALNSRVGIGNNNPNAPLSFAATLEKKITLYPGATGDAGFGMSGNRLQIFSDNPNADVAIGYDAAGTFNERFAVKPNGALSIVGNTGSSLQLLASKGAGSAAEWTTAGNIIRTEQSGVTNDLVLAGTSVYDLPSSAYTVTLAVPSRVILYYKSLVFKACVAGECAVKLQIRILLNGNFITSYELGGNSYVDLSATSYYTNITSGPDYFDLPAGQHNFTFTARNRFNQPTLYQFIVLSTIIPL